jgi:hypothetical protein
MGITKRERRERAQAGRRKRVFAAKIFPASAPTTAEPGSAKPATKSKYNAQGRRVNGIWCASDAEATRYEQLLEMQASGLIENLRTQVRYPLLVNNHKVCAYVADFAYIINDPELRVYREVVEEVKGLETPEWKLKCKLFEAVYAPLKISVIRRAPPLSWLKTHDPDMAEKMTGKMASFSHWIKERWSGKVPD